MNEEVEKALISLPLCVLSTFTLETELFTHAHLKKNVLNNVDELMESPPASSLNKLGSFFISSDIYTTIETYGNYHVALVPC